MQDSNQEANDDRDWNFISEAVLKALRRKFGNGPGFLEAERFLGSAARTYCRRSRAEILPDMSQEQLIDWLISVANNKWVDALRHREVEQKHFPQVADVRSELEENRDRQDEVRKLVDRLLGDIQTTEERIVFEGRLEKKTYVQIANDLRDQIPERSGGCSQQTARNIFNRLLERLRNSAAEGP